jgi:hypothetical protein
LLVTHRQVELRFVLVLFGFCHSHFFNTTFFIAGHVGLKQ